MGKVCPEETAGKASFRRPIFLSTYEVGRKRGYVYCKEQKIPSLAAGFR